MKMLDLNVSTPEEVAPILRKAAELYYESAQELRSAWQDPGAGRIWNAIARDLERCADRIAKKVESA